MQEGGVGESQERAACLIALSHGGSGWTRKEIPTEVAACGLLALGWRRKNAVIVISVARFLQDHCILVIPHYWGILVTEGARAHMFSEHLLGNTCSALNTHARLVLWAD